MHKFRYFWTQVKNEMHLAYRNIIFDLDGTLIDSRAGILASLRHTLGRLGHDLGPDLDLNWAIGPPLDEVMSRILEPLGDDRWSEAVALYREHYGSVGLLEASPYEGIAELLTELAEAGRVLVVATTKRTAFARVILEHQGWAGYFTGVYGSEPGGRLDRKADLVRHVLKELRLAPGETVMVGDREHDAIGARANAVAFVAAGYGYGTGDELCAAGAEVFCNSPGRLRQYLV